MQITLDLSTLRPATLAAIAADITQQIDAQDWTLDSYEPIDAILVHLFAIPSLTPAVVDDLLADAGAVPNVLDNLISRLIITNQIGFDPDAYAAQQERDADEAAARQEEEAGQDDTIPTI